MIAEDRSSSFVRLSQQRRQSEISIPAYQQASITISLLYKN